MITLKDITKAFGKGEARTQVLKGIDLTINKGEFVAIMGPSGSGKSTLLNILGTLDAPSGGTYSFEGVDLASLTKDQRALFRREMLGFIFQGFNLLKKPLLWKMLKSRSSIKAWAKKSVYDWQLRHLTV